MVSKGDKDRLQNERHQLYLATILKDDDNKYCADCDAKGPRWASWNIGVFLCIRCAGIHRNLGVHISKVKSVNLDTWSLEHLGMLYEVGNSRGRAIYEANLPDNFRRPQTDSALEQFIRQKYEHKRYIAREFVPPKPNLDALRVVIANVVGSGAGGPGNPNGSVHKVSSMHLPAPTSTLHTSSSMPQLPQPPSHSGAQENGGGISRPRAAPAGGITLPPPSSSSQSATAVAKPKAPEMNLLDLDMDTPSSNAPPGRPSNTGPSSSGLEDLLLTNDFGGNNTFGDFVASSNATWPSGVEESAATKPATTAPAGSSTKSKEDILSLYGSRPSNAPSAGLSSVFGGISTGMDAAAFGLPAAPVPGPQGYYYAQPPMNPGGYPGYMQAQIPPQSQQHQQQQQPAYWNNAPSQVTGGWSLGPSGAAAPSGAVFGMQHNPFFANSAPKPGAFASPPGGQQQQAMFAGMATFQQPQVMQQPQQAASQQAYLEQIQQKLSNLQMNSSTANVPFSP